MFIFRYDLPDLIVATIDGKGQAAMSAVELILRECGRDAGIGIWRFDARRSLLHWPRGFGPSRDESYGSWYPLGEFGQWVDPADRAKFFDFFDHVTDDGTRLMLVEVPIRTADGPLPLRIEGKALPSTEIPLAAGLVRNIRRRHEAEDRARSLSQILDAVMLSGLEGIIVLDAQRHVRKANRQALRLFGLDPDAPAGSPPSATPEARHQSALEGRLPAALMETLATGQSTRSAIGGTLAAVPGHHPALGWHANPWGRGGMVLVVEPRDGPVPAPAPAAATVARPSAAPPPAASPPTAGAGLETGRAMLDYVHHPCLIIQTRDASVEFANRAAREKLGLKPTGRTHINNLFELSGRHAPHHVYVTADRVSQMITLPMGARVSRMVEIDPDLIFVEYR